VTPANPITIAAAIAAILDSLGIRYVIGGSVAASIYGEPRSTLDIDLMIAADENQIRSLVEKLRPNYYVDEKAAAVALESQSSFNAIHYKSSTRVDFFIAEREPFVETRFQRRRLLSVGSGTELSFYAPEDLIVRKLLWYRAGAGQSERQWRDVIGILKVSPLDLDYLRKAAAEVRVSDLLDRALQEA
jgi:Nucleotidyl transferase AbiEii toxin, Type IV TA system